MARGRSVVLGVVSLAALLCSLASTLTAFVSGPWPAASSRGLAARHAEETLKKEDSGDGFVKFMKEEQEIELSPEEYQMALEQEVETQRKRYYIGGVVKDNNLIVPWKPVVDSQLEKDARAQLKKNGILDPAGEDKEEDMESDMQVALIGQEDVQLSWTMGTAGQKVGYIIEKKRAKDTNFREIASYENADESFLLVQESYAGQQFAYEDQMLESGSWSYRVLVRDRSGAIQVVDQKDITVPETAGVKFEYALGALLIAILGTLVGSYFADGGVRY